MTDHDIRRALEAATPKAPDFDRWGDQVRAGHRRRRIAISAVAALGVVALGVPLALQVTNLSQTPIQATPSPLMTTNTSPTATAGPSATQGPTETPKPVKSTTGPLVSKQCVDSVGTVTKLPNGKLPSKATRMWLCDGDQEPVIPTYGPPEPLTLGVDIAISAFNALPVSPTSECPAGEYKQSYTVVVEYADREPIRLAGVTHGCKGISDGTKTFGGGDTYFNTLVGLWKSQREAQAYELTPGGAKVCLRARSFMGTRLDAAVRGFACGVPAGSASMHKNVIQRPLDPALVGRIVNAAKAEATVMPATEGPWWSQSLVLLSRFGDPVTLYRADETFTWQEGEQVYEWRPKPELLAEINAVTSGMLTGQPPVDPATSEPCEGMIAPAQGSLRLATAATLCRYNQETQQSAAFEVPAELFQAIVVGGEAATEKVGNNEQSGVTGSYIGLLTKDSKLFQVFIASDGSLLRSLDGGSQLRWQASPELKAWLVQQGVPITS